MTWTHPDGYEVSDDPAPLAPEAAHAPLPRSPWSPGVRRQTVGRTNSGSLVFDLYTEAGEGVSSLCNNGGIPERRPIPERSATTDRPDATR